MLWTISRNGGAALTLSGLGITSITLNRKSFDTDELVFVVERKDSLAAPLWAYGDSVALVADGVTRFQGRIRTDATLGDRVNEGTTYGAWNVWDDLKCLTYQQNRNITSPLDWLTISSVPTTEVTLFRNPLYGVGGWQPWTVKQQMQDALAFAESVGVSMSHDLGALYDVPAPWSEAVDIMVAGVLRRCQAMMVDLCGWFDYTTTPPTLRCVRRSTMATTAIDLTAGTQVQRLDRIRQRNDLVPAGVVLILLTSVTNPATGKTYQQVTVSSGGAPGGPRVIVNTIDLTALENSSTFITTIPAGGIYNLANDYYQTLLTPFLDGQLVLRAQDCPGTLHPGQLITFTHGRPDWSAAGGIIQEISEELITGTTIVRFGPPPIMSAAQFLTMALAGRVLRQNAPTPIGGVGGTSDGSTQMPGGRTVGLTLCDGSTVNVLTK
jgi:hypothetical protein